MAGIDLKEPGEKCIILHNAIRLIYKSLEQSAQHPSCSSYFQFSLVCSSLDPFPRQSSQTGYPTSQCTWASGDSSKLEVKHTLTHMETANNSLENHQQPGEAPLPAHKIHI